MRHLLLAALGTVLFLSGSLIAQDAMNDADELPVAVAQLGLTEVEVRRSDEHGSHVRGLLPDGAAVEVDLDRDRTVEEVEALGGGFAVGAVGSLVPAAVLANAAYPRSASLMKLELDNGDRVEFEGTTSDGLAFEAEFTANGRLVEMDMGW